MEERVNFMRNYRTIPSLESRVVQNSNNSSSNKKTNLEEIRHTSVDNKLRKNYNIFIYYNDTTTVKKAAAEIQKATAEIQKAAPVP
jgi:hypothetical protein